MYDSRSISSKSSLHGNRPGTPLLFKVYLSLSVLLVGLGLALMAGLVDLVAKSVLGGSKAGSEVSDGDSVT